MPIVRFLWAMSLSSVCKGRKESKGQVLWNFKMLDEDVIEGKTLEMVSKTIFNKR